MATRQYVTFLLKDEIYAILVKEIQEIIRPPKVIRLPLVPDYVEGIANLRGEILPVVDFRKKLGLEEKELPTRKVIVLQHEGKLLGISVDRTSQVIRADDGQLEEVGTSSNFVSHIIHGGNERLYMLVDVEKVMEFQVQNIEKARVNLKEAKTNKVKSVEEYIQIVTFEMSGEEYALPIEEIQEIIRFAEPTVIPDVPDYVKGIVNLRDSVLPIIDLRLMLGLEATNVDEFTKVIVLNCSGMKIGFVVDRIYEVLRIEKSRIDKPPSLISGDDAKRIKGIIKMDERVILLLDSTALVPEEISSLSSVEEKGEKEKGGMMNAEQYVVFKVGEEEYGASIEQVREINRMTNITKVPRAPKFVEGIMNLRGEVIPVVDLRKRFELETVEKNDFTRIIVADISGKKTGFIVDSVVGVERVPVDKLSTSPELIAGSESSRFVRTVANLGNERMILILDIEHILSEKEIKRLETTMERISEGGKQKVKKTTGKTAKLKKAK